MILIPAIDIRDGKVVRLFRGDYAQEKVYSDDPVMMAKKWVQQGAQMIHVVDLDGAREGKPKNSTVIQSLVESVGVPIQMGGGMRSLEIIKQTLAMGVSRVVIGTKALDEKMVCSVLKEVSADQIVVGIDASEGMVRTEGWIKESGVQVETLCENIIRCGVKHIVFTDIKQDGTLSGPNIESLKRVLSFSELRVVASGGVGSIDHIRSIALLRAPNVYGVIIGKALYEETLALSEALTLVHKLKEEHN